MVFGVFCGVLKLWKTFGVLWSILGGVDQRGAPCRNLTTLEDPFGRGPFHFKCMNVHQLIF